MKREIRIEDAHRLINPGCVVLVTANYQDRSNVMTLAWQTTLSSKNSPLVGIAIASSHFTCELINKSKEFVLNIPGADLLDQVDRCGKVSGRKVDKFQETNLTPEKAQKVSAPLIKQCLGHLECNVVDQYKVGDHTFFVGEIVAASADSDLFSSHWHEDARLIHHLGGNKYYISGQHRQI